MAITTHVHGKLRAGESRAVGYLYRGALYCDGWRNDLQFTAGIEASHGAPRRGDTVAAFITAAPLVVAVSNEVSLRCIAVSIHLGINVASIPRGTGYLKLTGGSGVISIGTTVWARGESSTNNHVHRAVCRRDNLRGQYGTARATATTALG